MKCQAKSFAATVLSMSWTYKSVYVTDSQIRREGTGGGNVSYHELNALNHTTHVRNIYQRVGRLHLEEAYPNNPFMFDYYIASLITNPDEIELAQFYGSGFTLTSKRLTKAKKFVTVPAHNLQESLAEWATLGMTPWQHLTDQSLFSLLTQSLKEATVICPSKLSSQYLLKAELANEVKIIPHGVDLPEKWSSERNAFHVFNLGQYGPDKGHRYLFEAWKLFNRPAELTIAGANITLQTPIPNVNILGYITEEQKNQTYAESAVYVQPSVTEGWGLEVAEAMAHGTPVIVTEGVGAKDMVEDGKDGFIVPTRDPQAIADKLRYFYENHSEMKRMGQNARAKAEQYTWDKIEKKYEELYLNA